MLDVNPRRTRRAEQAASTRERKARSALRLFVEQGFAAATIQSVAEAADVSVETIYKLFGSKQNLLRAAIRLTVADDPRSDDFVARFLQLPPGARRPSGGRPSRADSYARGLLAHSPRAVGTKNT